MTSDDSIYLDHGATSFPKAPGVSEAMVQFLATDSGNPGRGGHRLTVSASRSIETARERVAELLGSHPERTLLGPGATFWLNTVLAAWLRPGDRVVSSALEHNSVMRPLRRLERDRDLDLVIAEGQRDSAVPSPEEIRGLAAAGATRLVVLSHASNVTGAILPVTEIANAIAPVPVLVDGAQTAGSVPVNFEGMGVMAFACSGHKGLLGPSGTGVLLLAEGVDLEPLVSGGTGSRSESEDMPDQLPDRLEAGTPNGPGIVGLGAACAWLADRRVEEVYHHEHRLAERLAEQLQAIHGVRLHGWCEGEPHTGVLSFTVGGCDGGDLAAWLDRECGLMLRSGLHCAPAAHRRLGSFPNGTLRAGIGPFNTEAHVDALTDAIRHASIHGLR